MPMDSASRLWPTADDVFFRDQKLQPVAQHGPRCVSTSLAILTGATPESFQGRINTQDPVSWSAALRPAGMKLAYCPTDVRKLKHYIDELVRLNDLFTLSYYTSQDADTILSDPNEVGWVCGSHIVILHGRSILDPASGTVRDAYEHPCLEYHTKRVFRVVPSDHVRGL